jgi:hypothetical protein
MISKYSDLIAKILITAVVVVLTGLLIAWMAGLFKDKKQDLNSGTEKIDEAINSMADFDLLVYDGNTISGDTLAKLISDLKTKDIALSIWVNTLDTANAYYNYAFTPASNTLGASVAITPPSGKASSGYITPSANFLGTVIKNTNDEIVCLKFTQQK